MKTLLILLACIMILMSCAKKKSGETQTAKAMDYITIYEKNPCYWQYKGKPVMLVGGTGNDNLFQNADLKEHLDLLASVGGNQIRNTMSARDSGDVFRFKKLENGKYDLDQWNPEYWTRIQNLLKWCYERDIFIQFEVWDRFDYSRVNWKTSPWNPANNVNYTYEETGFEAEYPEHPWKDLQPFFHTIAGLEKYSEKLEAVRKYQERYMDKLLSHSLNYGNVLYCMNNETSSAMAWGRYWMKFIRDRAVQKGIQVYCTDMFDNVYKGLVSDDLIEVINAPDMYPFLDISQINSRNFGEDHWNIMQSILDSVKKVRPRPCNNTKIYGGHSTRWGSGTNKDGLQRFMRNVLGGCASARFHRPPTGQGLNDTARAAIKSIRKLETLMKMWEIDAHQELVTKADSNLAYCAAKPGEKYAVYFTQGGTIELDLSAASGNLKLKWINVNAGEWADQKEIQSGAKVELTTPKQGDWLAAITK